MKTEEWINRVAEAYRHPEKGEADRNGNTRLAVLQERFHLSSLKVQKMLVTAGVYEPVKDNTAYETVTRLRKEGKKPDEIMRITGFSGATVSACFPYTRPAYHAERSGGEASRDASRKRKQREREEAKRAHAREVLGSAGTDGAFWKAIEEHAGETFISTEGRKFGVRTEHFRLGETERDNRYGDDLVVMLEQGETISFSKADVLAVYHEALERKAAGDGEAPEDFERTAALPYVYPLLVCFGILPGDGRKVSTRRGRPGAAVCCCCGRGADYTVRTWADLVRIAAGKEEEERSQWDPEERERVERTEKALGRIGWADIAKRDNPAIRAFDKEGERDFCELCAATIRMALEDGELPRSSARTDLSGLPAEVVKAGFRRRFETFTDGTRYIDRYGRKYPENPEEEDAGRPVFLYRERDTEGIEHTFACCPRKLPGHMLFEAVEVHRLTKTGKRARENTGTDYAFRTGLKWTGDPDGEENGRSFLIGFLELAERIRDALRNPTLEWHGGWPRYDNAVTLGERQCMMRSVGEMRVEYVDGESAQGRKWDGGRVGFLIDGILFTGEEVAMMSSGHVEWNLQYRFADPSDPPLRAGMYLMPVQLGERELVDEVSELLNLFAADGQFISERDRENFGILFEKTVLEKLKLYHDSNPGGYGKLAGMRMIGRLRWIAGTERQEEQVRDVIRG